MRFHFAVLSGLLLLCLGLTAGCTDRCAVLADLACEKHGDDSIVCQTRSDEAESASAARERLCARAVVLYKTLPEHELSR